MPTYWPFSKANGSGLDRFWETLHSHVIKAVPLTGSS